jgi:hypothetical protein
LVHEEHQLLSTHQEIFRCEAISLGGSRDDQRVAFLMPGSWPRKTKGTSFLRHKYAYMTLIAYHCIPTISHVPCFVLLQTIFETRASKHYPASPVSKCLNLGVFEDLSSQLLFSWSI